MALTFASPQPATATRAPMNQQDKPRAQVWLNIGTTVSIPNPTTGEVEDVFVALPVGIPLDTMEAMEMRGSNQNWAHMVQAKNWLLEQLQDMGKTVGAGEEQLIEGLQIQIKRVGTPAEPAKDGNPFLTAMQGALRVIK